MATGQIKQIITFEGQDKASKVAKDVKQSVDQLDKSVKEKSGDISTALGSVADFTGPLGEKVRTLGDAFGGIESVTRLLPGNIGLAVTGIATLAAGAYLLQKHLSESAAKLRILASDEAKRVGASFGASADEVVALTEAFDQLGKDGLRPSDELIKRVRENAVAMGQDGTEAVKEFIAAWAAGPAEINKSRAAVAALGGEMQTIPQIAKALGLDPKSLGLEESKSNAEKLADAIAKVGQLQKNVKSYNDAIADAESKYADATIKQTLALNERKKTLEGTLTTTEKQLSAEEGNVKQLTRRVEAERAVAQVSKDMAAAQQKASQEAALQDNRALAVGIELGGIEQAREVVARAIARESALIAEGANKEAEDRKSAYESMLAQLGVQQKTLITQDQQRKEQERAARAAASAAAAAEKEARLAAQRESALRLLRAQASADDLLSRDERVKIVEAESSKELASLDARKLGRKAYSDSVAAIKLEEAAKIRAIDAEIAANGAQLEADNLAALEDYADKAAAVARDLAAEQQKASASVAASRIADAERTGNAILAAQLRAAENERSTAEQIAAIRADGAAKEQQFAADSVQAAQVREATALRVAAVERESARQSAASYREMSTAILGVLEPAAQLAGQLGGGSGLGAAMAQAVQSGKQLAGSWSDTESNASGIIGAVGSVASAFVEGEKEKAAILGLMEAAMAVASFPDATKMAAHGAAAAMYGAIAGGLVGGSSGGAPAMAQPAGFASQPTASAAGGQSAAGGTTVINFVAPLATRYEIGKSVVEAQKAAKGYAAAGV